MRRVWAIFVTVMAGGMVSLPAEGATPQYHFTDMGSLGGGVSYAFGINSSGVVVGSSNTAADPGHYSLFTYTVGGGMVNLGKLLGGDTSGNAINNAGQLAGRAEDSTGGTVRGFIYTNGAVSYLPTSMYSANAINTFAQAAGTTTSIHPALYSGGTVTDLGVSGDALGINDSAAVVGYYYTPNV